MFVPLPRVSLYAALCAAWALFAGCLAAPRAKDWLAVGYRTPRQTFATFQTGMRADLPDLEYRSLSGAFKRREGVTQLAYREFRSELFRAKPWLALAAQAHVRSVTPLADDRVRLVAEVDTWFHDETFAVELVREDYYEVWIDGQRVDDDLASWRLLAREKDGALVVTVPLPEGRTVREIGELRAGREWKIDGFPSLTGNDEETP